MEYSIGKYKVVPPKLFSTMDKAVEYIQGIYPELDSETIDQFLTPKITDNAADQSRNLSEENSVIDKVDSEAGTTGPKRIKPSTDKPR